VTPPGEPSGCGCRTVPTRRSSWPLLLAVGAALGGLRLRRRRTQPSSRRAA
jgi:MYXO-CTERM domain-containing protein